VGRAVIRRVFRAHYRVTHLAAELVRLGIDESLVAPDRGEQKKGRGAECEPEQHSPVMGPREIDREPRRMRPAWLRQVAALMPGAKQSHHRAEEEEARGDNITQNPQIRVARVAAQQIEREEQQKGEETSGRDHHPGKADPVMPNRMGTGRSFGRRNRGRIAQSADNTASPLRPQWGVPSTPPLHLVLAAARA